MKTLILAAIVIGILAIATLGIVNFVKAEPTPAKTIQANEPTCGVSGGCGASCSHTSAEGSCGCGASCGCSGNNSCGCKN